MKKLLIFLAFQIASLEAFLIESPTDYAEMDAIAIEARTDKSSLSHDYTRVYSNYFNELKNQPIRFLEIGIYKADSVKLWENYFPNAELHFIDITAKNIQYYSTRSTYHFADQGNAVELSHLMNNIKGEFDIIIDDGGHTMQQQITSFNALFPYVKSGGMYIIEDLHTSYWKDYGGSGTPQNPSAGKKTTIHLLKNLIDSVNAVGAKSGKANYKRAPEAILSKLTYSEKEIRSMHFYDSLCIIFKR